MLGETRGRLVHDQHTGVLRERLGDLGQLPVGRPETGQFQSRVDVDRHVGEDLASAPPGLPVVNERAPERFFGEEHVLRYGERRDATAVRSEEHTSELQSLLRSSYAVLCLKK